MRELFDEALRQVHKAKRAFRTPIRWEMHPETYYKLAKTSDGFYRNAFYPNGMLELVGLPIEEVPAIQPGKLALLCREDI